MRKLGKRKGKGIAPKTDEVSGLIEKKTEGNKWQ